MRRVRAAIGGGADSRPITEEHDQQLAGPGVARVIALQRAVGNRAVAHALTIEQRQELSQPGPEPAGQDRRLDTPAVQRAPDDEVADKGGQPPTKAGKSPPKDAGSDLKLPWSWGDYTAFELMSSGIRFLVAVGKTRQSAAKSAIPQLASRIAADNAAIADSARRVTTCFITSATTRFAYWGGKAVLMLDPADADVPTVAHEMGHAVLDSMMQAGASTKKTTAAATTSIPDRVADLYLRLRDTRVPADSTVAVGLMMVDPSEWSPGAKSEHPWENADEFFASAKAAYQVNKKGLTASIKKATRADKSVGPLAAELLALLDAVFGKGKLPTGVLPKDRSAAATTELGRVKQATQIADSVAVYPQLGWLIDPASRPGRP